MADKKETAQAEEQNNVWVCDNIAVTHCDVNDKGIVYTVTWVDFMGLQRSAKFNREDCYFDFATVLKTLVKGGYRYNTMLPQAASVVQQRLTAFRPSQESVQKALDSMKK